MLFRIAALLTPILILQARNVWAQDSDRAAILAVMEKAFAAVRSRNPVDWRAIQLAEGTTLSFRAFPDGKPDALDLMRISNNVS